MNQTDFLSKSKEPTLRERWEGLQTPELVRAKIAEVSKIDVSEVPEILATVNFGYTWHRWLLFRWKKHSEMLSAETKIAQLQSLAEWPEPVESIKQSIRNNWKGLFPPPRENGKYVKDGYKLRTSRKKRGAGKPEVTDTVPNYIFVPDP